MTSTRWIEIVGALFGIAAVYFNTKQNVLGWIIGLANLGLYTVFYFRGQLYGYMGLQLFFAAISLYGWYQWVRGGARQTGVTVTRTPARLWPPLVVLSGAAAVGLAWYLDTQTTDGNPYVDAVVTAASMAAQWMMARKYLESWVVWIAVNVVSVPLFLVRGEYPTALQYTVFLGLAVSGLRQWHRSLGGSS